MKKTVSFVLAALMLTVSASAAEFNDIRGHWAETVINELSDKGIVSGFGDGSFMPNGVVTRAEYLKMIMNAVGIEETQCNEDRCLDARKSDWYSGYLKSALDKGLIPSDMISGYKSEVVSYNDANGNLVSYVNYSGTFSGNVAITREEMAFLTISMYQYRLNAKESDGFGTKEKIQFADSADVSNWAMTGVNLAAANGFIQGMDDGSFRPKETTTRAQAATVISRVLGKIN